MFSSNIIKKNKRGFTLLEVMVAVSIFALLMAASSTIFANAFKAYRNARAIQKDLENAQYTMNLMAKTIRTSSVMSLGSDNIDIYDYSQDKCIRYKLSVNKIITGSSTPSPSGDKSQCIFSASNELSNISVENLSFSGSSSKKTPSIVGKVTISMKICATLGCSGREKDAVQIQTSVSLRDYSEAGL
jgi:prepilin-type N-terminal cleavage/methylation domain-containing protein